MGDSTVGSGGPWGIQRRIKGVHGVPGGEGKSEGG